MSENRIIIKTKDGETASFKDNEVHEAVQFHKDNGGSIMVDNANITEVVKELEGILGGNNS